MMTDTEFEQALDHWGGDLSNWPQAQAERARRYLADHPDRMIRLQAARQVDDFLTDLRTHRPPAHLAASIVARVPDPAADRLETMLGWLMGRAWRPLSVALVLGCAGYLAGALSEQPLDDALDEEMADEMVALAFADFYAGIGAELSGVIDDAQ